MSEPVSIAVNEYGTYLIYDINKCLCIVPKEITNRVTCILIRENRLDQGREFMRNKRASDQAYIGWSVKVEKGEESGGDQHFVQDGKGGAEGVPLSDSDVVAVSTGAKLLLSAKP